MIRHEISCGAVVFRRGEQDNVELLLLRHKNGGHWSFPKGHVEAEETERETAAREIHEETGLSVVFDRDFREAVHYSPAPGIEKDVIFFLAQAKAGDVHRQEAEIADIGWFSPEEAQTRITYPSDRSVLTAALRVLEKV